MQLSSRAAVLIKDMGRLLGEPRLAFDRDGWIQLDVDGQHLRLSYSPANDTIFMVAPLTAVSAGRDFDAWAAFELTRDMAPRRTRVTLVPGADQVGLIGEVFLTNMTVDRLGERVSAFVDDCRTVTARLDAAARQRATSTAADAGDPEVGDMIVMRP